MEKIKSPYLDLFEDPIVDDSIKRLEYIEYLPRDSANMDRDGRHVLETRDLDIFLLPHKAFLEVRGKLVKNDNTNYAANNNVALVNNGWSLFHTAELHLNDQQVEQVSLYLPQASTIMNLVSFSDDYNKSSASNMLWYKDSGDGGTEAREFNANADTANADHTSRAELRTALRNLRRDNYNSGFRMRNLLTAGNKEVCMLLPLSSVFGLCRDVTSVTRGIKYSLLLDRANSNNYIHRRNGVNDGKFKISHISLWMPKVEPNLAYLADLETKLASGMMKKLYFEQMRVYRQQYGAAELSPSWRVTTQQSEQLPRHIFVAFQAVGRDNSQEQNNMIFDNANLRQIFVRINSLQYPERALMTNFTEASRNYSRAYMMFQEAVNKYQDTDTGSSISVEEFASLYPIIHIDISKHADQLIGSPADIEINWQLGRNFQFGGADASYYVYAVILSDRYLTVNALNGKMNVIL